MYNYNVDKSAWTGYTHTCMYTSHIHVLKAQLERVVQKKIKIYFIWGEQMEKNKFDVTLCPNSYFKINEKIYFVIKECINISVK